MTNYKALFLDIDGTVLRPDDVIEDSTKSAVKQVQQAGIEVVLATGRPLHEVKEIAEQLNVKSFIGYNGAYGIYDEKIIVNETMNPSTIERFVEIAKENGHEMVLYTNAKNVFTNINAPNTELFIKKFHLRYNESFTPAIIDKILGVTLINLSEHDPALYNSEDDNFYFSQVNVDGLRNCYDAIQTNVNKGFAVKIMLDLLEIDPNQAIAFGDGMNDKEMLQSVGEGFAMGNASPNLFAYAKHKTTDVTNSGIYNGLKSIGLVK
ncbi:HAD family hydrolase [Radiobacillus sp. PE A8.2]|uniref:HAD family hydrolase n=1 Tax=Radiobacillus sp. PE A8.2 TaxID=3380349 RepID=UPI00388D9F95